MTSVVCNIEGESETYTCANAYFKENLFQGKQWDPLYRPCVLRRAIARARSRKMPSRRAKNHPPGQNKF